MNQYKMIVFDLDGTLLTQSFELLEETIGAVEELRGLGYRVSVATGRSYVSAKPFLDQLAIDEPMVFSNGAVVDNPETGFREVVMGIPLESALILLMLAQKYKVSMKTHLADGRIYKSDETPWPNEGVHFVSGEHEPNLASSLAEDPIKMVVHADQERMTDFVGQAKKILGDRSNVRFFQSHHDYFEISNKNVSKGSALLSVVTKLGLSAKEIITVGDQENDFEMLRDFGFGVMVGDVAPKLKEVTGLQVPPPEEQGIGQLVEWLRQNHQNPAS